MPSARKLFVRFQQGIKRLCRYPAVQRPNALENSLLAKLPVELLQQIANSLPVASAASFSLSCRQIYFLIGTRYLENLATSSDETLVFLKLIEQDLQNQIACDSCTKLHRMRDARRYTEFGQYILGPAAPNCLSKDRKRLVTYFFHENFSTTVFKMAMKHHRLFGYDARSRRLLKLLSGSFSSCSWWGALVRNQEAECRVKNDSLFTCKRTVFRGTCTAVEEARYTSGYARIFNSNQKGGLRVSTSYQ